MKTKIDKVIQAGVSFLADQQQSDGSFLCLVSPILDNYESSETCPAIVPSNIVLSSLANIPETETIKSIKDKTAAFLLTQKGEYWSFNYWFRNSPEYISLPYPDDLDDTFCALAALYEYDPDIFDGAVMAKIATMLSSAEEKEGGPYDMWLVPDEGRSTWKDTDLVVNSNIAFFLSLQGISLPGLDAFIDECIEKKKFAFPYCSDYPGLYFISRFYRGEKTQEMIEYILSKKRSDGSWGTVLETALAISALLNLSSGSLWREVEDSVLYILQEQSDGMWKPHSFFFQMRTKEKTMYAGSATITTSLCLEALNAFQEYRAQSDIVPSTDTENQIEDELYSQIVARVYERFSDQGTNFKSRAIPFLEKIIATDSKRHIVLLPFFFKESFGNSASGISNQILLELGAANLYGWIAYTIYDDFFDQEGDPRLLSVANMSLRESSELFNGVLPPDMWFSQYVKKVFDQIDEANLDETVTMRCDPNEVWNIPNPPSGVCNLAQKSLGHLLGPMAIMWALGYTNESQEFQSIEEFFKHYLIARQLNDDAHDWESDSARGIITPVVAELIRDKTSDTPALPELQTIFWEKTIISISEKILEHIVLARAALSKAPVEMDVSFLEELLLPIERSAQITLKEQQETLQFLRAFKGNKD